jgi:hypothetical protein
MIEQLNFNRLKTANVGKDDGKISLFITSDTAATRTAP